jgi:uncharacterized Zn finger protein
MVDQTSFKENPNFAYRLGIWKSRVTLNKSKAMEHNDLEQNVRTTMVYINVLNRGGRGVNSPADRL